MCSQWCEHKEFRDFPHSLPIWFCLWALEGWDQFSFNFLPSELFLGAAERACKEAAEREQNLLKQKLLEQEQQIEAQQRSLQENIAQLEKKLERERENIIKEQNMMLEHKLKVSLAMTLVVLDGPSPDTSGKDGWRLQWAHRRKHHCTCL